VARYKAIRDQYLATYPPLAEPLRPVLPRLEDVRKANYQAGIMGLSSSRSIYNALNDQLKDLQSLKDAIDKTPTLKAAVDLNTAVGLKNAQINAELLRTQAIGVYIQANSQASENNAQSAQAEFFQR
jgi:hypothetical protein